MDLLLAIEIVKNVRELCGYALKHIAPVFQICVTLPIRHRQFRQLLRSALGFIQLPVDVCVDQIEDVHDPVGEPLDPPHEEAAEAAAVRKEK